MKRILSNTSYSFNHIIYILNIHSKNLKDPKNSLKEYNNITVRLHANSKQDLSDYTV